MANKDKVAKPGSILGDINPTPDGRSHRSSPSSGADEDTEDTTSMDEGSGRGTGGVDTEVGGTRNFRQGSGASGGDIGNRPE